MAKKDGMYFYCDWLAPFEKLEKAEVGELVIAMMRYFSTGEEPPRFEGMLGMAADFIFPQIDRSIEYARLGSRGGNATKAKTYVKKEEVKKEEEPAKYFFEKFEEKEEKVEVKEEKAEEESAETMEQKLFKKMQTENYFNKFWRAYPKKAGKQQAFNAFKKLNADGDLVNIMVEAVDRQKETQNWKKEDGRYIPNPSNWLEGRRWEDEIGEYPRLTPVAAERPLKLAAFLMHPCKELTGCSMTAIDLI